MAEQVTIWMKTGVLLSFLAVVILVLHKRGDAETIVAAPVLTSLPVQFQSWKSSDVAIPDEVRTVLGAGDFLDRTYTPDAGGVPVNLFIAYFPSQRTGTTIHSPKNCLPGSGWIPLSVSRIPMPMPSGGSYLVNRYVVAKGADKQLVLYWYQAHNRIVASEFQAKFYLIKDAIKINRSDGALVRFVTPIAPGETELAAEAREMRFIQQLLPQLMQTIPS